MADFSYVVSLSLPDYLVLRGLASAQSVSFIVPAFSTVTNINNPIQALKGDKAVLLTTIQFSGVQDGQVGYDFLVENNDINGYAINGIPRTLMVLSTNAIQYVIRNNQASICVVLINYLSIPSDVMLRDIFQALFGMSLDKFGLVKGT